MQDVYPKLLSLPYWIFDTVQAIISCWFMKMLYRKERSLTHVSRTMGCPNEIMGMIFDFSTRDLRVFCDLSLWELLINSLFSFSGCALLDLWLLGF